MTEKRKIYYFTPLILGVILLSSNFLSTNLFSFSFESFTVWFVLSLFAFACGWLINKTIGWTIGGRMVFAVIVAASLISILLVSLFDGYFSQENILTENIILYTLRDITLGVMGFFGMSVSEIFILQKENAALKSDKKCLNQKIEDQNKEAKMIVDSAKLKAEKIVFEAEKKAKRIIEVKESSEQKLKELIRIEKELLKKYEEEK